MQNVEKEKVKKKNVWSLGREEIFGLLISPRVPDLPYAGTITLISTSLLVFLSILAAFILPRLINSREFDSFIFPLTKDDVEKVDFCKPLTVRRNDGFQPYVQAKFFLTEIVLTTEEPQHFQKEFLALSDEQIHDLANFLLAGEEELSFYFDNIFFELNYLDFYFTAADVSSFISNISFLKFVDDLNFVLELDKAICRGTLSNTTELFESGEELRDDFGYFFFDEFNFTQVSDIPGLRVVCKGIEGANFDLEFRVLDERLSRNFVTHLLTYFLNVHIPPEKWNILDKFSPSNFQYADNFFFTPVSNRSTALLDKVTTGVTVTCETPPTYGSFEDFGLYSTFFFIFEGGFTFVAATLVYAVLKIDDEDISDRKRFVASREFSYRENSFDVTELELDGGGFNQINHNTDQVKVAWQTQGQNEVSAGKLKQLVGSSARCTPLRNWALITLISQFLFFATTLMIATKYKEFSTETTCEFTEFIQSCSEYSFSKTYPSQISEKDLIIEVNLIFNEADSNSVNEFPQVSCNFNESTYTYIYYEGEREEFLFFYDTFDVGENGEIILVSDMFVRTSIGGDFTFQLSGDTFASYTVRAVIDADDSSAFRLENFDPTFYRIFEEFICNPEQVLEDASKIPGTCCNKRETLDIFESFGIFYGVMLIFEGFFVVASAILVELLFHKSETTTD